ncbi:hypothetical protein [Fluviicola sp.]|uniref:hypothetical protein n=1 Tax=Fluviicola sp. TaxID=1917219 RepID=UPI003D2D3C0A
MRLILSILVLLSLTLCSVSCEHKTKSPQNTDERLSFVNDSVTDLELVAKQLKDTSKETVTYELSILNHSSRSRIFQSTGSVDAGIRCEGGSMVVEKTISFCNTMRTLYYYQPVLAHSSYKHQVKLMRVSLRNPKFYWKLTEVDGINWDSAIIGTINLETH